MGGFEAVLLLGCAHGIALAFVLSRRARNQRANRYLAMLLAAASLLLLDKFVAAQGWPQRYPVLIGLGAWLPFLLGPLVYLYVSELTARAPVRKPWRHFVTTGGFVVLLAATFWPRSAEFKLRVADGSDIPWFIRAADAAVLVYGVAYEIAALRLLVRHRANVRAQYSNLRGVSLHWLTVLVAFNAAVWAAAIAVFAIQLTGAFDASAASAIIPLCSTAMVFVIGYFQLGQAEIFSATPEPTAAKAPAYQRARLANDDAAELEARIRAAMTTERLYTRPGLTLAELADAVAATPHEVSQVLSTRLQSNFYSLINEYRVEHVKAALGSGRPVLDLAYEAGFQSKSTFNAAFRKVTGVTPREFRQGISR